ncbi:MAG: hypothetical protein V4724_02340 [Pseudomonadota bacterium]
MKIRSLTAFLLLAALSPAALAQVPSTPEQAQAMKARGIQSPAPSTPAQAEALKAQLMQPPPAPPPPPPAPDPAIAKEQYMLATRQAAARYAADKKQCAEESDPGAAAQCQRDAKASYDKALGESKGELKAANAKPESCSDCARVTEIAAGEKKGEPGPIGEIAGGVVGALLGNMAGGGNGKKAIAAAAGAAGAYAGGKVEEKIKTVKFWTVKVQYDDGTDGSFTFDKQPAFAVGDVVRKVKDGIVPKLAPPK